MRHTLNYATPIFPVPAASTLPGRQSIKERRNATARSPPCARSASLHHAGCSAARHRAGRDGRGPAAGARDARSGGCIRDPQRRARVRFARRDRYGRPANRFSAGSCRSTFRNRSSACPAFRCRAGGITRRICNCRFAVSARAPTSACAACVFTRTTYRQRCRMDRGRRAASVLPRCSGSKCCAVRSRRFTATPRAGSSRCSPRMDRRRRRRRRR